MFGAQGTVLVLSDEAAAVYANFGGRYRFVGDVHWQDPEFVPSLSDLLAQKCRGRPITILYDMVEQYYRRETVPKVAVFDQRLVLERRLVAAFPNYIMRRALPLKGEGIVTKKPGEKDKGSLEGKLYLFAALPEHDSMAQVVEAIRLSMTYVHGIHLLPIESVALVQKLSALHNNNQIDPDRWIVFMSQHRGGGLRQIVIRNGELSLTRMTTVIDTTVEHNAWATQVAQEFSATMGYVSRFGYTSESPLEVIVIGHPQGVEQLQSLIKTNNFHGLSLQEAIKILRVPAMVGDQPQFADVLHVGWLAKQARRVLTFQNQELALISRTRRVGKMAAVVLVLAALGAIGYFGNEMVNLFNKKADIVFQKERLAKVEKEYKDLVADIEKSNIDVKLVQGSIAVYKGIETNKIDLIGLMNKMRAALTPTMALDKIDVGFEIDKTQSSDPLSVKTIETQRMTARMNISFSGQIKPEDGNQMVSELRNRIAQQFPDFDVTVEQAVKDMTYTQDYTYRPGDKASSGKQDVRQGAILFMRQKPQQGGAV